MKHILHAGLLSALALAAGCTTYQAGSQFQAGRQDLLIGRSVSAAAYFRQAANLDPNYEKNIGYMREGIWTYLGRADYDAGKLPQARQDLERALARNERDYFARLYLGLVLAKSGNQERGAQELRTGLRGLDEWFNWTTRYSTYGTYCDPSGTIRAEIGTDLAMLSSPQIDWEKLIASGEWVGKKTEEEIDLARRDEHRQYEDGDGRRMRRH